MPLTVKQKRKYIKNGWAHCLFCGSTDIEGFDVELDGNKATQGCLCHGCEKTWMDVYTLTGVETDD